jgi:hypothetical protein
MARIPFKIQRSPLVATSQHSEVPGDVPLRLNGLLSPKRMPSGRNSIFLPSILS